MIRVEEEYGLGGTREDYYQSEVSCAIAVKTGMRLAQCILQASPSLPGTILHVSSNSGLVENGLDSILSHYDWRVISADAANIAHIENCHPRYQAKAEKSPIASHVLDALVDLAGGLFYAALNNESLVGVDEFLQEYFRMLKKDGLLVVDLYTHRLIKSRIARGKASRCMQKLNTMAYIDSTGEDVYSFLMYKQTSEGIS